MHKTELTNQIADTLMDNVGMSKWHVKFDPNQVTDSEIDADAGVIVFELLTGSNIDNSEYSQWKLTIERLP